jgi:hypothetical protein
MGVIPSRMKDPTFLTPICNDCGICLCWDISVEEYEADKAFWEGWQCEFCLEGREIELDGMIGYILRAGKHQMLITLGDELEQRLVDKDDLVIKEQSNENRMS